MYCKYKEYTLRDNLVWYELRKNPKLTQKEIAKEWGISITRVGQIKEKLDLRFKHFLKKNQLWMYMHTGHDSHIIQKFFFKNMKKTTKHLFKQLNGG